jgi:excisionase family DNA binding protein
MSGVMSGLEEKEEVKTNKSLFENRIDCGWLNTKEAAQFLRLSENAVRIMVHRNQIFAHKFGRRLRFRLNDLNVLFARKGI